MLWWSVLWPFARGFSGHVDFVKGPQSVPCEMVRQSAEIVFVASGYSLPSMWECDMDFGTAV